MITQHAGKLTIKQIEELSDGGTVLNNYYYTDRFPNLREWYLNKKPSFLSKIFKSESEFKKEFELNWQMHGNEIAGRFGKPNCNMKGYESYPGAWVFYDTEYDIRWLVFSDGIRKNHFKGTSYEVKIPENLSEEHFILAIRKFFTHFGVNLDEA